MPTARTKFDPSWASLGNLEDHIYSTLPAEHDDKEIDSLVQKVRKARQSGDTAAYKDAVVDLLNAHMGSFKDSEAYAPYDYKSDGFLSPKEVAMINARFRNKGRQGTQAKTLDTAFNDTITSYRSAMPRIDNLYSGVPGSWDVKGAKADATDMLDENIKALTGNFNIRPAEARYLAQREVIKTLKTRSTDQKLSNIKVTDSDTGNSVYVHMTVDGSGKLTPKASPEDFAAAVAGLKAVRTGGLYRGTVNLHLLDNKSAVPENLAGIDDNTIAFTFDGANAVRVYVDRVHDQVAIAQANPGYWSTDITDNTSAMKHFVAHEVAHQIADEIYGSGTAQSISDDMRKFYNEEVNGTSAPTPNTPASSDVQKIVDSQKSSEDRSSWKQIGGRLGSNDGGTFEDPATGSQIYAKFPQTVLHGENERLASALYQAMGVGSTNIVSGRVADKPATYSDIVPGVKKDFFSKINDPSYLKKVQEGFAADAFLANWDSVLNDNIVSDANGDPVRIDPGGALLFRAQGNAKGTAFGDSVLELDTFTSGTANPTAVSIFGKMTQQQKVDSAKRVQSLKDSDIDSLVDSIITNPAAAKQLKTTLKNRRSYILKKFGLSDSADATTAQDNANAVSNQTVPAVSTRGAAGYSENFAELGAKYVLTGEAPDWFVKMLESRGIAKAKISTLWRQAVTGVKSNLLAFIDKIRKEDNSGTSPESDTTLYTPSSRSYSTGHGRLGSASGHKLARLNGVRENTPQLVDDFTPGWGRVFRGVGGVDLNGTPKTAKELHREFATSPDPYYADRGGSYYGDGIYFAVDKSEADSYGRGNNSRDNQTLELAIDPNAKVYVMGRSSKIGLTKNNTDRDIDDVEAQIKDLLKSLVLNEEHPELDATDSVVSSKISALFNSLPTRSISGSTQSNMAFLLGYDAIETPNGYVVVLNRGILQVRKKDIA